MFMLANYFNILTPRITRRNGDSTGKHILLQDAREYSRRSREEQANRDAAEKLHLEQKQSRKDQSQKDLEQRQRLERAKKKEEERRKNLKRMEEETAKRCAEQERQKNIREKRERMQKEEDAKWLRLRDEEKRRDAQRQQEKAIEEYNERCNKQRVQREERDQREREEQARKRENKIRTENEEAFRETRRREEWERAEKRRELERKEKIKVREDNDRREREEQLKRAEKKQRDEEKTRVEQEMKRQREREENERRRKIDEKKEIEKRQRLVDERRLQAEREKKSIIQREKELADKFQRDERVREIKRKEEKEKLRKEEWKMLESIFNKSSKHSYDDESDERGTNQHERNLAEKRIDDCNRDILEKKERDGRYAVGPCLKNVESKAQHVVPFTSQSNAIHHRFVKESGKEEIVVAGLEYRVVRSTTSVDVTEELENNGEQPTQNESKFTASSGTSNEAQNCNTKERNVEEIITTTLFTEPPNELSKSELKDKQCLSNYTIYKYRKQLLHAYNEQVKNKKIATVDIELVWKHENGVWEFNEFLLENIFNLEYSPERFFGILLDTYENEGSNHYICYEVIPSERLVGTWNLHGFKAYTNSFTQALDVLATGFKNSFQIPENFQYEHLPGTFAQNDGYNCGIACLLELENLISGSVPDGVSSLNDYRKLVQTDTENCAITRLTRVRTNVLTNAAAVDHAENVSKGDQHAHTSRKPRKQSLVSSISEETPTFPDETSKKRKRCPKDDRIDSVEKLMESISPHGDIFERNGDQFLCSACSSDPKRKGTFTYSQNHATSFDGPVPKYFSNFARNVKDHIKLHSHINAANKFDPQKFPVVQDNTMLKAGIAMGMNAYKNIILGRSDASFAKEMTADAIKGLDIGDINHSSNFSRKFRPKVFQKLKNKLASIMAEIQKSTGQFQPFAIVADKYTKGDTFHIIAIIFRKGDKLTAFVLDVKPVTGATGLALAKSILESLEQYFTREELKRRISSFAFDGQYFILGVDKHLMNLLEVPETCRAHYSFVHDPAHVIELAGKHARGQKGPRLLISVPWIQNVVTLITKASYKCGWGKGWQETKEIHQKWRELQESLNETEAGPNPINENVVQNGVRRFKRWCDTRFSTYAYEVFHNFRCNYKWVHEKLGRDKHPLFTKISSAIFAMRLCCLEDLYSHIGQASKAVQKVEKFPWHIKADIVTLKNKLNAMYWSLHASGGPHYVPEDFVQLKACVQEIHTTFTYQGQPMVIRKVGQNGIQSTQEALDRLSLKIILSELKLSLAEHISSFHEYLDEKFESPILQSAEDIFALRSILGRANSVFPDGLESTFNLSKQAGATRPDVSAVEFLTQYGQFTKFVHETAVRKWPDRLVTQKEERKFYMSLLSSPVVMPFPDVLHLASINIGRASCESVSESMGSVVKSVLDTKPKLCHEALLSEVFTRWNGPRANVHAIQLIKETMNELFGKMWHTHRTSEERKLKKYGISMSVDRENQSQGRIEYEDTGIPEVTGGVHDVWEFLFSLV